VLVLAVQNSVDYEQLGIATSGVTLFRAIGGALGVAMFGAIFAHGLQEQLNTVLPPGTDIPGTANPDALQALSPEIRAAYLAAIVSALRPLFIVAATIAAVGFLLTLGLREVPLRGMEPAQDLSETFLMPRDATSLEELERIVAALLAHENRWRVYADIARRAQLDLSAPELWMLARLGERAPVTAKALSEDLKVPLSRLEAPLAALCERGIVDKDSAANLKLTAQGASMRERLLEARRKGLVELMARWQPDKHPEVLAMLERMVTTLVRDLPAPQRLQDAGQAASNVE
jgi:DNA-binding MarR family transcriptional regulator